MLALSLPPISLGVVMSSTDSHTKKSGLHKNESIDEKEYVYDEAKGAALTRKIDWNLLPILTLLYLLSFLDRYVCLSTVVYVP